MPAHLAVDPVPAAPAYGLTRTQYFTALIIQEWQSLEAVPPSFDELAVELGLTSKSEVCRLLNCLKARGIVDWIPGHSRSLVLRKALPWPPGFADERPELEIVRLPEEIA